MQKIRVTHKMNNSYFLINLKLYNYASNGITET